MSGCKPSDTPINPYEKLSDVPQGTPVEKDQYQHLVGKLIYISHIRPNIAFVVSVVSQFMHSPHEEQ